MKKIRKVKGRNGKIYSYEYDWANIILDREAKNILDEISARELRPRSHVIKDLLIAYNAPFSK